MSSYISKFISFNYNFGINISLSQDFPTKYLSPLNKVNVIISENGNILESSELSPGQGIRFPFSCYQEADIKLFSYINEELVEVWEHKFSIQGKNVIVDLRPQNQNEFEIWVEYLKWFQNKTSCNLFLTHEGYHQNLFPSPIGNEVYASYVVYWNEDMWANPLGVNVNPYDLINNALFRI